VAQFLSPIMAPLANLYRGNQHAFTDYFEFRQCVEARAAHDAALRATDVERAAIRSCLNDMRKAHKLEDPAQEAEADVTVNIVVLHVMRAMSELLRNNIFFNRKNLYLKAGVREKLLQQHTEIGEAVIAGDAERAEAAAGDHIRFVFDTVEEIQRANARLNTSLLRAKRSDFLGG
jgi:GntR family transcriptional repressor for pyruvate dehydrogenase complex